MLKINIKRSFRKAIGFFCALVLIISTIWVPFTFNVSAANALDVNDDEAVVFGFEDSAGFYDAVNKTEYETNGVGMSGWGACVAKAVDDSANSVLSSTRPQVQTWATGGGFRLHKKVGEEYLVYNLVPNARYIVSFKVRVTSSSRFTDDVKTPHECYISMGYGAKKTGSDTNYVDGMSKVLVKVVSTKAGSGVYTLATDTKGGKKELSCSTEWQTVIYEFTAPSDFGSYDTALAFLGSARTGFNAEIDDLSITRLAETTGLIKLVDEYTGKTEIKYGTIGNSFDLPDISDRAKQESHKFSGWYTDEKRTESAENISFAKETQTLYSAWTAPVTVTFVDEYNETEETVTGIPGGSFDYPEVKKAPEEKWFAGWYTTKNYTEEHTSGVFGYTDITLYAYYEGYEPFERVIDYSKYTVVKRGNSWSYTTDSEAYQSIVKDENATGGAYLHFHCDANTAGAWLGSYTLTLAESGTVNISGSGNDNVLFPNGVTYKVTVRMRTNTLSGRPGSFFVSYGSAYNSALNNANNNHSVLLNGVKETENFVTYEFTFTTPDEYIDSSKKCYLGFTVGGSVELDYDIDYIKLQRVNKVDFYTVENGEESLFKTEYLQPGETVNFPPFMQKEIYDTLDNTGKLEFSEISEWYTDKSLSVPTEDNLRIRNDNAAYYGKASTTVSNSDNQVGFCGFDLYKEDVESTGIDLDGNLELSKNDAYSGGVSLKATGNGTFEIRNDNFFTVTDKTTYNISFAYKADKESKLSLGFGEIYGIENNVSFNEISLEATDEWKTATAVITADFDLLNKLNNDPCFVASITTDGTVYIDTVTVSSVVGGIGALKLKSDVASASGNQALRFMFAYKAGEKADEINIDGKAFTVAERGILLKDSKRNTALTLENLNNGIVGATRTAEMDNCWSYNSVTSNVVFSTFVKGLEIDDERKVSARGYVKLGNGTVYYGNEITVGLDDITDGSGIIGDDADLTTSGGYESMNDYYVYLPEGTEIKGEEFKVVLYSPFFVAEGSTNPASVSEYVMEKGSYVKLTAKGKIADLDIYVPSDVASMVEKGSKDYLSFDGEALKMGENIKLMNNGSVNYIFITDLHHAISSSTRNYMIRQMNTLVKIANENDNIDFVVVGGDVTTGMFATKQEAINNTQDILNPLKECNKPLFVLFGNHDDNSYHVATGDKVYYPERIISDYDWDKNILDVYCPDNIVKDSEYSDSKYYYYDMADKKTRLVFLDTVDCRSEYDENGNITKLMPHQPENTITSRHYKTGYSYWGYDMEQVEWLANEAMTAPDDWNYVYLSHMGIDGATNSYGNQMFNSKYMRSIMAAFQNKTAYTEEGVCDVDFSNTTGKITVMSFGHQHTELTLYDKDIDLWQISTACGNIGSYSNGGNVTVPSEEFVLGTSINTKSYAWTWYYRKLGTPSQNCFDVISANEKKVEKYAFGTGCDKTFYYE